MTISKGEQWGALVKRPDGLLVVESDAELTAALATGLESAGLDQQQRPVLVVGGDLHRTMGARQSGTASELLRVPIDLLDVSLDGGARRRACAHVVAQRPWWQGGWWRGEVLMVMNAQFIGDWHVVARGHPNDGRAEFCGWDATFGMRSRWQARRRLPTNAHVPHPQIGTGSFTQRTWRFPNRLRVRIDGVPVGWASEIDVRVRPDAATLFS